MKQFLVMLFAALGATAAVIAPVKAADISGAGATFPYPLYAKWADTYKKETDIGLNYQSIGSGGGIKQIEADTVTFGASDKPLPGEELEKNGLVQFPTVMGGIVPVVNLEGVKPGDLVLDGPTLAKIYLGEITTWNDPAIAKLNPGVKLPSDAIAVVFRSDGSGTTFVWTNYLSKVSADFKSKIGSNTSVQFPVGIGAKGNEGVANNVMQTKGSIGYVESPYAKQNKLAYTKLVNKDGKTVAPVKEAFQAAAASADWASAPGPRRHPDGPGWCGNMADHEPNLHPDSQEARRHCRGRRMRSSSLIGLMPTATRWPKSSTMFRCLTVLLLSSRRAGLILSAPAIKSVYAPTWSSSGKLTEDLFYATPAFGALSPIPHRLFRITMFPCSASTPRAPWAPFVALLQKFDRNEIGRAHERHVTVAWRCSILKS